MGRRDDIAREHTRAEAAMLVRKVAGYSHRESVKTRIARAAERLGWSYRRTEDIWRREAARIEAHEMDALRGWRDIA